MGFLATGVVAGVLGTLVMDGLNLLFARMGLISKIDVAGIGRMAAGWMQGRYRYRHPSEMKPVRNEVLYGYLTHYAIGIGLSVPFAFAWAFFLDWPPSPAWILAYGLATTVASWFFVYPSMGFGALGLRSPDGIKASVSSLSNHLFYGLGLAAGVILTC